MGADGNGPTASTVRPMERKDIGAGTMEDFSMSKGKSQRSVADYLSVGEDNAVHAVDLVRQMGLPSERALRLRVAAARRTGRPICSGVNGYWLSQDQKDAARCAARLRRAGVSALAAAKPLRSVPIDGQEVIGGSEDEQT